MILRRRNVSANARRIWPALRNLSALEKWLTFYLLAVWALVFVLTLAPPNGADYDSLVYHLAVPAQYSHVGRVEQLPFDHHSYFPLTMEMLYGVALQLRGPVFAKLFHWLMLPLGAAVLIALGNRAQTRVGGLLAACLFTSSPMTLAEATTAYVDLAFAAFAVAAVLCFAGAPTGNRTHNLGWSGAFCGFCLGTKYFGWLIFGFLGIWLLVEMLKTKPANGARGVWLFGLSALAIGGAWYVRNWVWVGNPVYPFAYGVFGGRGWTPQMATLYDASQAIYGFGRSPLDLILLPFRLAMTPLNVGGFENLGARGQPFWPLIPGPVGSAAPNSVIGYFDVLPMIVQTFPRPGDFRVWLARVAGPQQATFNYVGGLAVCFSVDFLGADQSAGALFVSGAGAFVGRGRLGHDELGAPPHARSLDWRRIADGVAAVRARFNFAPCARFIRRN